MIFFDVDGTLVDYRAAEHSGAVALYRFYGGDFPLSEKKFVSLWRQLGETYMRRYLEGHLDFAGQRRARMRALHAYTSKELTDGELDRRFQVYRQVFEQSWGLFSDVRPCLNAIRNRRLGIITNGDYDQQIDKLKKLEILDFFTVILSSSVMGVGKPSPQIFEEACRLGQSKPEDSFYVGDNLNTDARAASQCGLTGIWLNRNIMAPTPTDIPVIQSLATLPDTIKKLL